MDLNRCLCDSNLWLSASFLSSPGIWISWMRFESIHQSTSYWNLDSNLLNMDLNHSYWVDIQTLLEIQIRIRWTWIRILVFMQTYWNRDSNHLHRDSNHCLQILLFALFGIGIWIFPWGIQITFIRLNFLESRFESSLEGFESLSSFLLELLQIWRIALRDSNPTLKNSNLNTKKLF